MKILIASPEGVPYVKTGGLADVAGALCEEYRRMKKDAFLILPFYRKIMDSPSPPKDTGIVIDVPVGDRVVTGRIFRDRFAAYFIACDEFFDRSELYGTPEGDYVDNASRFIFFSRGVLEACRALKFKPDVIHCNDWQTGLIPLYLKTLYRKDAFFSKTASLLTLHNIGYQGLFPAEEMPLTNLGWEFFRPDLIEFYGKVNFLKAGLISADVLNTVSNTYSKEILEKEFGYGLEGVLKNREGDLYGIVNGIDYEEWDPSTDRFLQGKYSQNDVAGKAICKRDLLKSLFRRPDVLKAGEVPLVGMVGRLSAQKGLDLVGESIPALLSFGIKLVILGKGDEKFQKVLSVMSRKYSGRVSVTIGFDDALAHRIYAGADFFLMPSRYEPCGLGQLISQRYGTIPVARKTGGLADTIVDYDPLKKRGTGFLFSDYTASAMQDALKRAFCVFTDGDKMKKMMSDGMKRDFSWKRSAERYILLYSAALKKKAG
jgi:starch synthase